MKTKNAVRIRVNTVTCPDCKAEFYSRARHDFRTCDCPFNAMVDGGFDYFKRGGMDLSRLITRIRYVKHTRQELYDDWNHRTNKLGIITKGVINAK